MNYNLSSEEENENEELDELIHILSNKLSSQIVPLLSSLSTLKGQIDLIQSLSSSSTTS